MAILTEAVLRSDPALAGVIDGVQEALEELRGNVQESLTPKRYPCYVVESNGHIFFYYDWDTCKVYVRGTPDKFKKVKNAEELDAFLTRLTLETVEETVSELALDRLGDTPPWE